MPVSGAEASYGDLLLTSLVVLVGVCIGAFVVVRLVGRWVATGRVRGAHLLDVVARMPLEPRRSLYVVEVAGKTLLVGTSEMGLSVLSELDANEVKARVVPRQTFAELVRAAWMRRRRPHENDALKTDASTHDATSPDATKHDARMKDAPRRAASKSDSLDNDASKADATKNDAPTNDVTPSDAVKNDVVDSDAPNTSGSTKNDGG